MTEQLSRSRQHVMNQIAPITSFPSQPALIADAGEPVVLRFLEFFTARMANDAGARTTQLYDRLREELSVDKVEEIGV